MFYSRMCLTCREGMVVLAYEWKSFHIISLFVLKLCIHLPSLVSLGAKIKNALHAFLLDTLQINAALCEGISF